MKFYMRDPDAALNGMAELTLEQRGAYNSILDLLYSRDGVVLDDDVQVARMIRLHWRTWRALKLQLIAAGKIWVEPTTGMLNANRVSDTLMKASRLSQEQRRRVSKRWQEYRKRNENNGAVIQAGNTTTTTIINSEYSSKGEDSETDAVDEGENFGQVERHSTAASADQSQPSKAYRPETAAVMRAKGWIP